MKLVLFHPEKIFSVDVKRFRRHIFFYVRPVRRIGTEIRSGPVRSAVSDRSRTDLGPDRFDENFFPAARNFQKKSLERCGRFRQKIVEIGAILAIFEPFEV